MLETQLLGKCVVLYRAYSNLYICIMTGPMFFYLVFTCFFHKFINHGQMDFHMTILHRVVSSHFVPRSFRIQGISYLLFGHFVPSTFRTQVISYPVWSFRTKVRCWSVRTQVISYPFWPFHTLFGYFVSSSNKMDGWIKFDF